MRSWLYSVLPSRSDDFARVLRRALIEARIRAPLVARGHYRGPPEVPIPPTDGINPPRPWPKPVAPFGRAAKRQSNAG